VAVNQSGYDHPAARIQPLGPAILRRHFLLRADPPDDAVIIPRHRGVWDGVNVALPAVGTARHDFSDVAEELQVTVMWSH
jgi:hypothetical protein